MGPVFRVLTPELVLLGGLVVPALLVFLVAARRARRLGYSSSIEYLRAAPRTASEKRDAIDLALLGLVLCGAGMLFPPLVPAGLVALFFGGRKVGYVVVHAEEAAGSESRAARPPAAEDPSDSDPP